MIDDPRFNTNPNRTVNRKQLSEILETEIVNKTTGEWINLFTRASLPCSPIYSMEQICAEPVIAHREMLVELDQPVAGKVKIVGSPIRLSETPGKVLAHAPLLGEHTRSILTNILNYSQDRIQKLEIEGVINEG